MALVRASVMLRLASRAAPPTLRPAAGLAVRTFAVEPDAGETTDRALETL
jgi:hypothetical protein